MIEHQIWLRRRWLTVSSSIHAQWTGLKRTKDGRRIAVQQPKISSSTLARK